jgi:hypothetical protein
MRITANGYFRNHGSKLLAENDLAAAVISQTSSMGEYIPRDKAQLHVIANDDLDKGGLIISMVITDVTIQSSSTYRLAIRFTLSDIFTLFWLGFKERSLNFIFQRKAHLVQPETSTNQPSMSPPPPPPSPVLPQAVIEAARRAPPPLA